MPTTPFVVDRFGGVDLLNDPQEVGASTAVDALNVLFDRRGRLRARDGYIDKTSALTPTADRYFLLVPVGSEQYCAVGPNGTTVNYDEVSTLTPTITNRGTVATGALPQSWVAVGGIAGGLVKTILFTATGDGNPVRQWDIGTSTSDAAGKGAYVAALPLENRLAQARFAAAADTPSGANGSTSTVFFSDAGVPNTYTASSWVQLQPGDGEDIMAMGSWQNYLFVFKRTTMFVFYGTSTDADGLPIFNYRRISLPEPLTYSDVQPVAGPDGLYFLTAGGIYRTTGDVPANVSGLVRPVFDRSAPSSLAMGPREVVGSRTIAPTLSWIGRRLLFNYYTAAGAQRQLVWDQPLDAWTVWNLPTRSNFAQAAQSTADDERLDAMAFGGEESTVAHVYEYGPVASTDDGATISWSYTSGAYDLSANNRVSITLESALWGSGTATLQVANDVGSFDTGSALTLGTAPALAQTWQQIDREGTFWQHKLSGTGAMVVNRLTHYVRFVKPAGVA